MSLARSTTALWWVVMWLAMLKLMVWMTMLWCWAMWPCHAVMTTTRRALTTYSMLWLWCTNKGVMSRRHIDSDIHLAWATLLCAINIVCHRTAHCHRREHKAQN